MLLFVTRPGFEPRQAESESAVLPYTIGQKRYVAKKS